MRVTAGWSFNEVLMEGRMAAPVPMRILRRRLLKVSDIFHNAIKYETYSVELSHSLE
jgi:hypothetical protein